MTVYVVPVTGMQQQLICASMMADGDAELRAFAFAMGIPRNRMGSKSTINISLGQRITALQKGAREISMTQFAQMTFYRRKHGKTGTPEQAAEFYTAFFAQKPRRRAATTEPAA